MEEKDTLLFEVILDIPGLKEKAEIARTAIARLREEKRATDKELKDKTISVEEYAKSMQAIDTALSRTQAQLKGYQKTLSDNDKVQKSAAGSIDQMRAQLPQLTNQYTALSKEQRENSQDGKDLQKQIRSLSDELKRNEAAIGSNSRNVGNYSQAVFQAISPNNSFIEKLRGATEAFKGLKVQTSAQIQGLRETAAGMSAAEKASFAFGLSLKAIGIGLLITAIVAVIGFLTKFDAGMDRVKQATAGASAAFEVLLKAIMPIGEAIVNAVIHPIDSIKKLTDALAHPIDSFIRLKNAALGIGGAMSDAARSAVDYTKAIQALDDRQTSLIGKQAQVKQQVELAISAAEDQSRTYKERIRLLDDAGKAELALARQTTQIESQRLTALIKRQKEQKKTGDLQRADIEAYQKQLAATTEAYTEQYKTEQEIQNRRSSLIEQQKQKDKQAAEDAKKMAEDAAKERIAEAERALIQARRNGIDTLKIEEEIIRRKADLEKIATKKGSEQRKLIEAQTNAEILALWVAHAAELQTRANAITQAGIASSLTLVRQGSKQELALQIERIQAQAQAEAIEINKRLAGKENLVQREIELGRVQLQSAAAIDEARRQFEAAEIARELQMQSNRLQFEEDFNDVRLADLRGLAGDRITLEEETQIKLLDLELKYNRITQEEHTNRYNAIVAKAAAAIRELNRQIAEDEINNEKARAASRLAIAQAGTREELQARIDAIDAERKSALNAAKLTADERKAIEDKANREIDDLSKDFRRTQLQRLVDTVSQANDALSKLFESQIARQNQMLTDQQEAALKSAGLSAEVRTKIEERFAKRKEQLDREAGEKRRKIQTVENIIQIASGVIAAQKEPFPFNLIKSALVIATGAAQQAVIASQKFKWGGEIDGPSHERGGVKYQIGSRTVELEGKEGVINKRSMAIPGVREQASRLNQLGGGVAFPGTQRIAAGTRLQTYLPHRMEWGGMLSGASGGASIDYGQMRNVMLDVVSRMPAPIVRVVDITDGVSKRARVQQRADIGG